VKDDCELPVYTVQVPAGGIIRRGVIAGPSPLLAKVAVPVSSIHFSRPFFESPAVRESKTTPAVRPESKGTGEPADG
jgi:hypothetical protein